MTLQRSGDVSERPNVGQSDANYLFYENAHTRKAYKSTPVVYVYRAFTDTF